MKSTLYKLSAYGFLIVCTFWPTSCARIVELPADPNAIVAKGDVTGRVVLPQGTTWSADELTVTSQAGDHLIKQGNFFIDRIDTTRYKLLFTTYSDGEIALISPLVAGQNKVTINAVSTALTLLMITPFTSLVMEKDKILMIESFRKHNQFPSLVSVIEEVVKAKKPLMDDANIVLFSLVNTIQVGTAKSGGRKAALQKPVKADLDAIDFALNLPMQGQIRLINNGSAIPYFAALYTETGSAVGEPVNLGNLRITQTGVSDIWNALKKWINDNKELDNCQNSVLSAVGSSSKPSVFCDLFKLDYPEPKILRFPSPGRYTIKVICSKTDDNNSELQAAAEWATLRNLVFELISGLDATFDKTLDFVDCTKAVYLAAVKTNINVVGQNNLGIDQLSNLDKVTAFIKIVVDFVNSSNECKLFADGDGLLKPQDIVSKKYVKLIFSLLGKALKILDLPAQLGAGLNIGMMVKSALAFKPYYEYCVDFDGTIVTYCKKEPTDTNIPNEVEEDATAVSTADPHLTTFDRGRYSFMGVGEFVAAKSTTDNFQVQVRQSPYPGSTQVSINTGVAVQVGPNVVSVYPPNSLYVNRRAVPLNFTTYALSNGGSLAYQGNRLTIATTGDDRVEVKLLAADLDYFITPGKIRKNKLRGLLGNYDGNPQNDIQKVDGQVLTNTYAALYPAFANSWRINQTESLFEYDGKTPASYTDTSFPHSEVQLSAAQRSAAEQICRQAGVTDAGALEGCIVDVALTGNQTFASRAKENEIVSNAKTTLSVSNFAQYRTEFMLGSGATISGNTAVLSNKGTIRWQDAYLNREGYETEVALSVNATGPCFPLFDLEVIDNQATGDQNDNYLRLSNNSGRTQVELVNSGMQAQVHPVNLFDGNRHRIRVVAAKGANGAQTRIRLMVYIDNYNALIIDKSFATASLGGYLYPMLKNETLYCTNSQITIYGWSFKGE